MLNFNTDSRVPGTPQSKRPQGHPTRGKTTPNRLRRVDNFVTQYDPTLIHRRDGDFVNACFLDLGYGFDPTTTLESAARLRRLNPNLPVLGVEIDPERVTAAQPFSDGLTHFRLGGFNLPLLPQPNVKSESVRLIRAFNVLRCQMPPGCLPPVVGRCLPHGVGRCLPHGVGRCLPPDVTRKEVVEEGGGE